MVSWKFWEWGKKKTRIINYGNLSILIPYELVEVLETYDLDAQYLDDFNASINNCVLRMSTLEDKYNAYRYDSPEEAFPDLSSQIVMLKVSIGRLQEDLSRIESVLLKIRNMKISKDADKAVEKYLIPKTSLKLKETLAGLSTRIHELEEKLKP